MRLSEILTVVQKTSAIHNKYVKEVEDILEKDGVDNFFKDFKKCLIIAFNKDFKLKNPFLNRYFDFCISFIDTVDSKSNNSKILGFITHIFNTIFECLEATSVDIRYHACLLIYKYIQYLIKRDKTIKDTLYERIREATLDTLEDVNPQIRIISANILKLVQNSDNSEDPVSSAFIDNLGDANGKVRAAIVDALNATHNNLPHIINRCRDVDEHVRITTFKKVADIPVQSFTIEQRQFLLKSGLRDRNERVRKCLDTFVLPAWLKYYECDYIKFLKAVQLDSNKKEIDDTKAVAELLLKSLFSTQPIQEILETLFLEEKLIPLEKLTWESTLFWKTLISHLKTKNLEQYWELILPETVLVCNYIDKFCSTTKLLCGSIWEEQLYLLILHELLCIAIGGDITDEANRIRLFSFLVTTLKERKVSEEIVNDIVKYFCILIPNVEQRVNFFCEMISDIRSPLVSKSLEEINEIDEKKRELNKKLKQLLTEKLKSIEDQEFEESKQINIEIASTKEMLQSIEDTSTLSNEEEHSEKNNDPEIVIKCLNIALALLQSPQISSIHPALKSLKEEIFMELMKCEYSILQEKYYKCYGTICSLDKTAAQENIQFFCLPLTLYSKDKSSNSEVLIPAIHTIGDLILIYGTKILPLHEEQQDNSNHSLDFDTICGKPEVTLNEVVDILSLMLDDQNMVIRQDACEVLIKLLFTRRIESPDLFSRIFIKWLSPASAEDVRLRQTIGVFIELFSELPDIEQQLEESVIPILRTIALAPLTSPLASVSKDEMLKLIIKILNLRHDIDYPIHANLATSICMEIQKDYTSNCIPLFVKSLLYLELCRDDTIYIDKLLNMSEDILIELRDKRTIKNIQKFIFSLKHE